jgi:hypothetical protein
VSVLLANGTMRPNPQEEKWKDKRDDDIALIGVRAHPPSRIHALTHARKLTFKLLLPRGGGCDEFKSEQVAHLGDRMPGLRRAIEMVRGVPFALQQCVLATDFPFVHLIPGTFLRAMFVSNSRTEQTFKRQNQIPRMD